MRVPEPLRQQDFRSVWLAGLVSDAGDWLLFIALPVVVYQLTGSALGTSFAFLVELAPGIVLAPLAGPLADRWDARRVLLTVSIAQAAALVPLLAVHSRSDLPILYAVILVEAALTALFDPVKNAMLPTLLPPEELLGANALVGLNQNLGRLVGGPLGGVVLAMGGLRLTAIADVVSYLLAAAVISRLTTRRPARPQAPPPPSEAGPAPGRRRGLVGSNRFLAAVRDRRARVALFVAFTAQIAQGIFVVLFVLFVARRLHQGSTEIGLLRGVQAIGAVGAGLVLTGLARRVAPALLTASSATALGVLSLAVWNAPTLTTATALYVALFILVGAPGVVLTTAVTSTLQLAVSDTERGRAFAALNLAGNAGQAIGMLVAGLLTAPLGLTAILDGQATLYLLAGAIAACSLSGRRRIALRHRASRRQPPAPLFAITPRNSSSTASEFSSSSP